MGKFAILLVMALNIAIFYYNVGLQNTLNVAEIQNSESFKIAQARNIAIGAAQSIIYKLENEAGSNMLPASNQTLSFPPDQSSYIDWADVQGKYRLSIQNINNSQVILTSIGHYEGRDYQVNVALSLDDGIWSPQFPLAVFSYNTINLTGNANIAGSVGTNSISSGAVVLGSNTSIDSTLYIGPGGLEEHVVSYGNANSNNVGNGVENLIEELDYPLPVFPDFPGGISREAIAITSNNPPPLEPAEYAGLYIPNLNMNQNTVFEIQTGGEDRDIVLGNLNIQSGTIRIVGDGNVNFHVNGNFDMGGNTRLERASGYDGNIMMFYSGTASIDLAGNSRFHGSMYALTAEINVTGNGGIQGHIITGGSDVKISGNAELLTRVLYAPNATVEVLGNGKVVGPVIANNFLAVGNASVEVILDSEYDEDLPELEVENNTLYVVSWN